MQQMELRNNLTDHLVFLSQRTTNLNMILINLIQQQIISEDESQLIKLEGTDTSRNFKLLSILQKKDWPRVATIFLEILRNTNNDHCADKIEGITKNYEVFNESCTVNVTAEVLNRHMMSKKVIFVVVTSLFIVCSIGAIVYWTTKVTINIRNEQDLNHETDKENTLVHKNSTNYTGNLRIAALNEPLSGDMHGVRGADYNCYRQARNANLQGTFRAFLTSWIQNLDSIVKYTDRNLPVLNTKGDLLFNSWSEIFQGNGKFVTRPPPIYSFNGRNVIQEFHWPQKLVWHGADQFGVRARQSESCEAWHSDKQTNVGLGSDLLKGQLMGKEKVSCNHKLVVLCIEIASQQHYRRRRRNAPSSSTDSTYSYSNKLLNLTYDEYTQFLDNYDQANSNSDSNDKSNTTPSIIPSTNELKLLDTVSDYITGIILDKIHW